MPEKNALPLIKKAMAEKAVEVVLPGEDNPRQGFLIKISGEDIDPLRDFDDMYESVRSITNKEKARRRLAEEDPKALRNHGVLIDPEKMGIIFTFNMAFADLLRDQKRFIRFPLDVIFPVVIPDYYGKPCRDGEPCFGERAKRLVEKKGRAPQAKVVDGLGTFMYALGKHEVSVQLPGESVIRKLYLIKMWAKTDFEEDYKIAYPDDWASSIRVARLIYGKTGFLNDDQSGNRDGSFREYGIFIDPENLELVFAFNTAYADYDSIFEKVIHKKPITSIRSDGSGRWPGYRRHRRGGMEGLIMYSLAKPRVKVEN